MRIKRTCSFLLTLLVLVAGPIVTSDVSAQENSRSDRPRLGVRVASIHGQVQLVDGVDVANGVLVTHVFTNSPAEQAGLQQFDVIQELNGTPISSVRKLRQHLRSQISGESIKLSIYRDGETRTVHVGLGASGSKPAENKSDEEKMDRVLKKMKGVETDARPINEENGLSPRSPDQLRRKMKSFLQQHPPSRTSNQRNNEEANGEATPDRQLRQSMKHLRNRLQKTLGDRLNGEQLDEIVEEFRSLAKEMSETDMRTRLKTLLEEMQDTLKQIDGNTVRKLSEWKSKIKERISEQMSEFEKQLDRKMDTFEQRMEKKMEKYSNKLQNKVEELNRLTEKLRKLKETDKNTSDEQKEKQFNQPYLGIRPAMDPAGKGILIREVEPDSPADRAGLKKGDVIRKMNGDPIDDVNSLQKQFYEKEPGEEIELFVEREGWTRTISVKLGHKKSDAKDSSSAESPSGGNDATLQKKLFTLRGEQRDVLHKGKRAMWMLDLYTHYQNGQYWQVLKNGVRRGMDELKQQVQDTPLQLKGRVTVQNAKNGSVLFSVPLDQNLADAVRQMDRVLSDLLGG